MTDLEIYNYIMDNQIGHKMLRNRLSVNVIVALRRYVNEGKKLSDFKNEPESEGFTGNNFGTLCNYVLPLIFTDEEMDEYFLKLLLKKYGNDDEWTYPNRLKAYKEFVGLHNLQKTFLEKRYEDVYMNVFKKKYFYPKSVKEKNHFAYQKQ